MNGNAPSDKGADEQIVSSAATATANGGRTRNRKVRSRSRTFVLRGALVLITTALALGAGEGIARCIPEPKPYRADLLLPNGEPINRENAIASGGLSLLPREHTWPDLELGFTFAPNASFLVEYVGLKQPWLDESQRVKVVINGAGVRDSADLGFEKPEGQKRIVCLGDSVTFGWGVPIEMCWTELVEADLRRDMGDVRTVNTGFCGTMMADESYYGLKFRFHKFDPDAVVMTLCLNDLFESNSGMRHMPPPHQSPSKLWNIFATWWQGGPTALPSGIDWGAKLLSTEPRTWRNRYWIGGGPQKALRNMHEWCKERDVKFAVVIWPFFQCLDDSYPFQTIHDRVGEFCAEQGIPFLDLIDAFRGQRDSEMWIAPNDAHANPTAQKIASPVIADFFRKHAL